MCNNNCNQGRDCPGDCGTEIDETEFDMMDYLIIGGTVVAIATFLITILV